MFSGNWIFHFFIITNGLGLERLHNFHSHIERNWDCKAEGRNDGSDGDGDGGRDGDGLAYQVH